MSIYCKEEILKMLVNRHVDLKVKCARFSAIWWKKGIFAPVSMYVVIKKNKIKKS